MTHQQKFATLNIKPMTKKYQCKNEPKIVFSRNWNMKETKSLIQLHYNVKKLKYLEKVDDKMIEREKVQEIKREKERAYSKNETMKTTSMVATPQIHMFS